MPSGGSRKIVARRGIATMNTGDYDTLLIERLRDGYSVKEISRELKLSVVTVHKHLQFIREQHGVRSNVQLIYKYYFDKVKELLIML